jgi:branched-chain amino acid transport system substrate-binding protein
MDQAGVYSTVLAYLRAAVSINSTDGRTVVAEMKRLPFQDPLFSNSKIRADGRVIHDLYLARVKTPTQSRGPWDYYEIVSTLPAEEAFRPIEQGDCTMLKTAR